MTEMKANVIKLSTDDHWQSLQKTLKPGMEQSYSQIVIPGFIILLFVRTVSCMTKISLQKIVFSAIMFYLINGVNLRYAA